MSKVKSCVVLLMNDKAGNRLSYQHQNGGGYNPPSSLAGLWRAGITQVGEVIPGTLNSPCNC